MQLEAIASRRISSYLGEEITALLQNLAVS